MNKVQTITKLLDATRGRFFSITFLKRSDGTERTLIGRLGVAKYVNGVGMKYKPRERGLVTIWTQEGYRTIPCESVTRIAVGGKVYNFEMPKRLSTEEALRYSIEIAKHLPKDKETK